MSSRTDNKLASLHPSHNRALEPRFIANVDGGLLSKSNLLKFIRAFFQVSGIDEGYYLEFGVFNGQSAIEAYGVLRGIATRIYGFDSFAGLPGLSDADARKLKLTPSFAAGNSRSLPVEVVRQYILASATRLAPGNCADRGLFLRNAAGLRQETTQRQGTMPGSAHRLRPLLFVSRCIRVSR